MKNKFIKVTALLLAASMLLAGCSSKAPAETTAPAATEGVTDLYTEVGTYPIVNEPITMSVFASQAVNIIDFNTNAFTKYMEELTGIDLEFETAPQDAAKEKVNLIMTGGDMP